jgi:hypothetical protein
VAAAVPTVVGAAVIAKSKQTYNREPSGSRFSCPKPVKPPDLSMHSQLKASNNLRLQKSTNVFSNSYLYC